MLPDLQTLNVPGFARAHDYFGVWAIEPSRGSALWEWARRTNLGRHVGEANSPRIRSELQTVKVSSGSQSQSIAVVMLTGPLMKSVSSADPGTSTVQARRELRKAAADPDVSAILLAIDSPGGTVAGTADLAAEIRNASAKKPVWAFVDDLGASAAYWAASQADKVFANDRTALVGSIGTLAVVYDLSAAAEQNGVKTLVFGTGPLKGAGAPGSPVTEEQQAYFRAMVEDAQTSFDAAVRKGRGLTEKQLADAKTGGVFGAEESLHRKLIDGIQSFDKTLSDLAAEAKRFARQQNQSQSIRATSPIPVRSTNVNELNATAGADAVPAVNVTEAIEAFRRGMAAEQDRIAGIQRVTGRHADIASKAIADGWTVEKAELAAMKADLANNVRSAGPHIATGVNRFAPGVAQGQVIEASLLNSLGRRDTEKLYSADVMEAAHSPHYRGMGLQQLLITAAVANGYDAAPGTRINDGNLRGVLKAAFNGDPRSAGTSTVSLPGILGTVANKELLAGYMEGDQTWREVAAVKTVNNFQQVTSYRMLDSLEYEEVGPDGKIKHGSVDQESYTRQAKTYARMFALTRRDIINDDLGAFADMRTRLGMGSAKKFNNVFWTKFLYDHATFFTTARTNYISGATTNLGTDGVGLGLGIKAFRQMTTPSADGAKRIGGNPDRVIVPPELEGVAMNLYKNMNLGSVKVADANIYANLYRPVVVSWLSDSSFTGYSTTAWYLLRNPAEHAMMVVSFLNGMQSPTVESADADFDTLGIQFRGYHDFGCDQAEYLAGAKSKGAA
jgi:signal peptide peptidase SppA